MIAPFETIYCTAPGGYLIADGKLFGIAVGGISWRSEPIYSERNIPKFVAKTIFDNSPNQTECGKEVFGPNPIR